MEGKLIIQEKLLYLKGKKNLAKNYTTPRNLKHFLAAIKLKLFDPKNRNKVKCNLPDNELKAILKLVQLQRGRQIIIKVCDKGAGIFFKAYMKACHDHLESKTPDGEKNFVPANQSALVVAKDKLSNLLQKCLDNEYITQEEYQARLGSDMNPGKFYSIFKVHKQH